MKFSLGMIIKFMFRRPIAVRSAYEKALANLENVEKTAIPIEKTNGPILMVSGDDDQIWPADVMVKMAVDRLEKNRSPHPFEDLAFEKAGHVTAKPYLPAMNRLDNLISSPDSLAASQAGVDAWNAMLKFFKEHLK